MWLVLCVFSRRRANLNNKDRRGYTPLTIAAGRAPRGGDSASKVYDSTMALLLKVGAPREAWLPE